jgi:hypothetical protein
MLCPRSRSLARQAEYKGRIPAEARSAAASRRESRPSARMIAVRDTYLPVRPGSDIS